MKPEMRSKIIAYNRERAADREKADDLMTLLAALPPGQVRNLLKDEACAAILRKYGVEEAGE
ncbi:MAG: hypothetical protein ACI4MK_07815 [Aristaeellaceae bacterium]